MPIPAQALGGYNAGYFGPSMAPGMMLPPPGLAGGYPYDSHMMTRPLKVANMQHQNMMHNARVGHQHRLHSENLNHQHRIHSQNLNHANDMHRQKMHLAMGDQLIRGMPYGGYPYGAGVPNMMDGQMALDNSESSLDSKAHLIGQELGSSLKSMISSKLGIDDSKAEEKNAKSA